MNKKLLVSGIVFIALGVAFVVFAFLPANTDRVTETDNWNRLNAGAGVEAEGVSTSVKLDPQPAGARYNRVSKDRYCPVYEFKVSDVTRSVSAVGKNCLQYREDVALNDTESILYDPNEPSVAFVKNDATARFYKDGEGSTIVALVFGGIMAIGGVFLVRRARKNPVKKLQSTSKK